jgi:hypothetical protein
LRSTIVEFYAELEQMKSEELGYFEPRRWHEDRPQQPKVWKREDGGAMARGAPPVRYYLHGHPPVPGH